MDVSHYHIEFQSVLFNRWLFPVSCYYKQSELKTLVHPPGPLISYQTLGFLLCTDFHAQSEAAA